MVFILFTYLDSVNFNHSYYIQLWQFFHKKTSITFDLREIEKNKLYLVGMTYCCPSNAIIKNVNRKKNN